MVASDRNSPETSFKRGKDYKKARMAHKTRGCTPKSRQSQDSPRYGGVGVKDQWEVNAG